MLNIFYNAQQAGGGRKMVIIVPIPNTIRKVLDTNLGSRNPGESSKQEFHDNAVQVTHSKQHVHRYLTVLP
jgi:hypothetical protein